MGVPHNRKPIRHINDIDSSTVEGRFLLIAIGQLEIAQNKPSKQVLDDLNKYVTKQKL